MKKLLFLSAVAAVFLLPANGCRVLKHKTLDKKTEQTTVKNDVAVSKVEFTGKTDIDAYKFSKNNTTVKETITYKTPVKSESDEAIELTASFKIDTANSLKGDTALTLTGPGVSLTIVRNPKTNNLTATIKKNGSSKKVDVNEIRIDRTITSNTDIADSTKSKLSWNELKVDSLDKSIKQSQIKTSNLDKTKESKPNYLLILASVGVLCFAIYIILKFK